MHLKSLSYSLLWHMRVSRIANEAKTTSTLEATLAQAVYPLTLGWLSCTVWLGFFNLECRRIEELLRTLRPHHLQHLQRPRAHPSGLEDGDRRGQGRGQVDLTFQWISPKLYVYSKWMRCQMFICIGLFFSKALPEKNYRYNLCCLQLGVLTETGWLLGFPPRHCVDHFTRGWH